MAWRKSPTWLVESFGELVPTDRRVEPRKMFGYPCAFACGNMFIGLHQESMLMRLPDEDRERFLAAEKSKIFEPFPGRAMREYVVVPHEMIQRRGRELAGWIDRSLEYACSLPRKGAKKGAKTATQKGAKKAPTKTAAKPSSATRGRAPKQPAKRARAPARPSRRGG
jgi:hypothetical protein